MYDLLSADIQNFRHIPLKVINKMILYRLDKAKELRLWDLYCIAYQNMDQKSYKDFDTWRNRTAETTNKKQGNDEIIAEAERLKKIHQNRKKVI